MLLHRLKGGIGTGGWPSLLLAMADAVPLRNVGFFGHSGAGKTTLAEALLQAAGTLDRRGKVPDGTSFLDVEPEEIARGMSLGLAFGRCRHQGHDLTLITTPGYPDFDAETRIAAEIADGAVIVVDALSGVETGTIRAVEMLQAKGIPFAFFVSKCDRENGDFTASCRALGAAFEGAVLAVGPGGTFDRLFDPDASGCGAEALIEAVVEADDDLLSRYLDGDRLEAGELLPALARRVREGKVHPVIGGSGLTGEGAGNLLHAIVALLPPPTLIAEGLVVRVVKTLADPYAGRLSIFKVLGGTLTEDARLVNGRSGREERLNQIFRLNGKGREIVRRLGPGSIGAVAKLQDTATWDLLTAPGGKAEPVEAPAFDPPSYRLTVSAQTEADEEKLTTSLRRLAEEDLSLALERDEATGTLLVAGRGDVHLDVLKDRLKRKMGVDVVYGPPPVAYRETIRREARAEGKHKKQTGGHGQYGHVWLEVAPAASPFVFVDHITGGVVPQPYRPAVEKGVREAMAQGVLAGYPVTGVRVTLYDGSYHPVDSSEMAFKIAGALAFRKAAREASPVLLEPVMEVEVKVPETLAGDVIGDLNRRRGRVVALETNGKDALIRAHVPQAELGRYTLDLRSLTGGRASFRERFFTYEEMAPDVARNIIERGQNHTA